MWLCKCGEYNPDGSKYCQVCGDNRQFSETVDSREIARSAEMSAVHAAKMEAERQAQAAENYRRAAEEFNRDVSMRLDNLRRAGAHGYYQYRVIDLMDDSFGGIRQNTLEANLNQMGLDGWQLKCAYTNELGRNENDGVNATVEQNILIFERFVRFQ